MKNKFFSFASLIRAFVSAALDVVAFSHRTCFPAFSASTAYS